MGLSSGLERERQDHVQNLSLGLSIHAKDSYRSGLKRQIPIMLLWTPVGIAKKRPMIHFFLPSFSHSLKCLPGVQTLYQEWYRTRKSLPLRSSQPIGEDKQSPITFPQQYCQLSHVKIQCWLWLQPICMESIPAGYFAPLILGAGFLPERGFPWQLPHSTGKSCLVCFISSRVH